MTLVKQVTIPNIPPNTNKVFVGPKWHFYIQTLQERKASLSFKQLAFHVDKQN